MLNDQLIVHLKSKLSDHLNMKVLNLVASPVIGGSINRCYKISGGGLCWFLKTNSNDQFSNMFESELKGMNILRVNSDFQIPEILFHGSLKKERYLVMEFIEEGSRSSHFWSNFGRKMAQLHLKTQRNFGLDHANYIGSLHQSNTYHESWPDFYINERLIPQIKLARDRNVIDQQIKIQFESLFVKLKDLVPEESPSLLHGDFWSGNFLTSSSGLAILIDPAVYFGHREMDIAMSKLFGGFDDQFYTAYNELNPLEVGWENRTDLSNLYPLMVHVNIFGGGYIQQVKSILKRFA